MSDFEKGAEAMRALAIRLFELPPILPHDRLTPFIEEIKAANIKALRALPLPAPAQQRESRLKEGQNVWLGYCDLCNGHHCIQTLAATGDENIRRPHQPQPLGESREASAMREVKRLRDLWNEATTALREEDLKAGPDNPLPLLAAFERVRAIALEATIGGTP